MSQDHPILNPIPSSSLAPSFINLLPFSLPRTEEVGLPETDPSDSDTDSELEEIYRSPGGIEFNISYLPLRGIRGIRACELRPLHLLSQPMWICPLQSCRARNKKGLTLCGTCKHPKPKPPMLELDYSHCLGDEKVNILRVEQIKVLKYMQKNGYRVAGVSQIHFHRNSSRRTVRRKIICDNADYDPAAVGTSRTYKRERAMPHWVARPPPPPIRRMEERNAATIRMREWEERNERIHDQQIYGYEYPAIFQVANPYIQSFGNIGNAIFQPPPPPPPPLAMVFGSFNQMQVSPQPQNIPQGWNFLYYLPLQQQRRAVDDGGGEIGDDQSQSQNNSRSHSSTSSNRDSPESSIPFPLHRQSAAQQRARHNEEMNESFFRDQAEGRGMERSYQDNYNNNRSQVRTSEPNGTNGSSEQFRLFIYEP